MRNSTILIKAFGKDRSGEKKMDFLIHFYVHFSVLSMAFIDVANLIADFACTCHCRMHFVCINVNKLVQTIEGNTRKKRE